MPARPVAVEASIRDRMTQRLQRMDRQVGRFGRTWERTGRMGQRAARMLGTGMTLLDRSLSRLWRRARLASLALQVTASIMGGMAVKAAMDYERAIRSVFTLMDDAGSHTAAMQQQFVEMDATLRGISNRTKAMPQDLAAGLYNVVSTGFEAADAAVILETAARGAYAGLTTVDTAAGLLTSTLQAFRQEGESSADMAAKSAGVMDMFFNAVNVGVFTFEELGMKFGDVASTAAAFGVKLEDLLAFLSTATVRGVGLDESIVAVRQTLLSIASATPASKKALETLFGSSEAATEAFSAQALASQGLIGVMGNLSEVIGGKIDRRMLEVATAMEEEGGDAAGFLAEKIGIAVEAFTELFPNVRALKGVLAVSGPGLETYAEHYDEIATNMGAVDRAAKEIDKSASGAFQGLKAAWEQFKIDVGNIALPWIKSISDGLVDWWGGLPQRFAEETGRITIAPGMSIEEDQNRANEIANLWAGAAPGEKIGFILRTAWSDAITNLTAWFESGGGEEKISALGERVGSFIGKALSAAFGLEAEDIESNLFYKIGKAAAQGFMDGFTANFSLGDAAGSVVSGEGVMGTLLQLYGGAKLLKWLLGRGAVGAAGAGAGGGLGGAAAAGAGGGLMARLFGGGTSGGLVGILSLLGFGAVSSDISAGREDPNDSLINRALGMFGIGPASVWGGPNRQELESRVHPATPGSSAAGRVDDRPSGMTDSRRIEIDRAGRKMDGAGTTMHRAAVLQYMAAVQINGAAGKMGAHSSVGNNPPPRLGGPQALGSIGTVKKPTWFLAGEAGSEDYEFSPHRGGKRPGGKGGGGRSVSIAGPLIGQVTVGNDYDVKRMMAAVNREIEKALANG